MKNVILAKSPAAFPPPAAVLHRALAPILEEDGEDAVEQLLRSARRRHAGLIVVRTPASPRGPGRSRRGSFTQTLIEKTRVPVLSVRPRAAVPRAFHRAVFLSDLSPRSAKSFRALMKLMPRGSSVVILHRLESPVLPSAEYPATFSSADFAARLAEANESQAQAIARKWSRTAARRGVSVELMVCRPARGLASEALKAVRRAKADVLALTVEPHPVTRLVLGSVVTELIQASAKPVLVLPAPGV